MSKNNNHIRNWLWVNRSDEMRKWCMWRTLSLRGDVCVAQIAWAVKLVCHNPCGWSLKHLKTSRTSPCRVCCKVHGAASFSVLFVSLKASCPSPWDVPGEKDGAGGLAEVLLHVRVGRERTAVQTCTKRNLRCMCKPEGCSQPCAGLAAVLCQSAIWLRTSRFSSIRVWQRTVDRLWKYVQGEGIL